MTCENCIHFDICNEQADGNIVELMKEPCFRFMELVRCKDCKHYEQVASVFFDDIMCCTRQGSMNVLKTENDFCSWGEKRSAGMPQFSDEEPPLRLEDLYFSARVMNCLRRAKIYTVEQLAVMSDRDLMKIRNFGAKCLEEVRSALDYLQEHGYLLENTDESFM